MVWLYSCRPSTHAKALPVLFGTQIVRFVRSIAGTMKESSF
ncbi:hypothetical protein TNIN_247101, partial [Trichonephila inaurata madagascariensis]